MAQYRTLVLAGPRGGCLRTNEGHIQWHRCYAGDCYRVNDSVGQCANVNLISLGLAYRFGGNFDCQSHRRGCGLVATRNLDGRLPRRDSEPGLDHLLARGLSCSVSRDFYSRPISRLNALDKVDGLA